MKENLGVRYRCMELRIRALHPAFSAFHLHACNGCEAPAFQEPCPVCNWYTNMSQPQWNVEAYDQRAHWRERDDGIFGRAHTKAECEFMRQVEENHNGNVALWYTMSRLKALEGVIRSRSVSLPDDWHTYDLLQEFKEAVEVASWISGLPAPAEIVQMVRANAHRLRMARELTRGDRIEHDGMVREIVDTTFAPGEAQSTHSKLTLQCEQFGQLDIIAPYNEEFLLAR